MTAQTWSRTNQIHSRHWFACQKGVCVFFEILCHTLNSITKEKREGGTPTLNGCWLWLSSAPLAQSSHSTARQQYLSPTTFVFERENKRKRKSEVRSETMAFIFFFFFKKKKQTNKKNLRMHKWTWLTWSRVHCKKSHAQVMLVHRWVAQTICSAWCQNEGGCMNNQKKKLLFFSGETHVIPRSSPNPPTTTKLLFSTTPRYSILLEACGREKKDNKCVDVWVYLSLKKKLKFRLLFFTWSTINLLSASIQLPAPSLSQRKICSI